MRPFLYSVNPWVSHHICATYRSGRHYAWCSKSFDARKEGTLDLTRLVPPSSNPAELYRRWQDEAKRRDRHSDLIKRVGLKLTSLAVLWEGKGEISALDLREIAYMVNESADFNVWRPLLYVIDRSAVEDRLVTVDPKDRAGVGPEYILEDLTDGEFDVLEFE